MDQSTSKSFDRGSKQRENKQGNDKDKGRRHFRVMVWQKTIKNEFVEQYMEHFFKKDSILNIKKKMGFFKLI